MTITKYVVTIDPEFANVESCGIDGCLCDYIPNMGNVQTAPIFDTLREAHAFCHDMIAYGAFDLDGDEEHDGDWDHLAESMSAWSNALTISGVIEVVEEVPDIPQVLFDREFLRLARLHPDMPMSDLVALAEQNVRNRRV